MSARTRRWPGWGILGLALVHLEFGCLFAATPMGGAAHASEVIHVSPRGSDRGDGSVGAPVATWVQAQRLARSRVGRVPVEVRFQPGTYFLEETVVLTPEDSGTLTAPVTYRAAGDGEVVISGGRRLQPAWRAVDGAAGLVETAVEAGLEMDQLFVNGSRQPMARYPNVDPGMRHFNGFAADAFDPIRVARWADPRGAFMHAMHRHEWGDYHYRVTGKDDAGRLTYEGGWQNNRQMGMHDRYRMIENVREELDAPGEWFHDRVANRLLLHPPAGVDLASAVVDVVRLRHLVEFRGTTSAPVRHVHLSGFVFRHAARTFMENREPLLRSDWTTYRGGALVFTGAEDCSLSGSVIDQVGGNAVFVDGYNRRVWVRECEITGAGANGVAFVGRPSAVRSPLFEYEQRQTLVQIDREPGPKSEEYPADCGVEDCLITRSGRFEKQTAPVQIAMAQGITVRHCSIYEVPRAGINIGDGTWGGHVIEHCDVFDTVLETGDHGSFNSWGRDRYWGLMDVDLDRVTLGELRDLPVLDAERPTRLLNNRWRCDHGWDIDLDDGSSRYEIRNNLCLNGGIKLREGFYRVCENNVMVNNSFHPHVWYQFSEDIFRRNIVFTPYRPIRVPEPWGQDCDGNLLHRPGMATPVPATNFVAQSGRDRASLMGDARFVDPARGDYRVQAGSPALALGFVNFSMDQFGVRTPWLRARARTPRLPAPVASGLRDSGPRWVWRGATLKNLEGAEYSVVGVSAEAGGVLVAEVAAGSEAEHDGLQRMDWIRSADGKALRGVDDLGVALRAAPAGAVLRLEVRRNQFETSLVLPTGAAAVVPARTDRGTPAP